MKNKAIDIIKREYPTEEPVLEAIDEAIPDFLDENWEDEYEDENEAYQETGRGEAEAQVRVNLEETILGELKTTYEGYLKETGEELWDTIYGVYDCLNKD